MRYRAARHRELLEHARQGRVDARRVLVIVEKNPRIACRELRRKLRELRTPQRALLRGVGVRSSRRAAGKGAVGPEPEVARFRGRQPCDDRRADRFARLARVQRHLSVTQASAEPVRARRPLARLVIDDGQRAIRQLVDAVDADVECQRPYGQ